MKPHTTLTLMYRRLACRITDRRVVGVFDLCI